MQECTDSEPSLCNTPNPLLPPRDEGLQFCARGYGWELMEMMGTSLRNPSFQHQPDPTSHPTQQDRQEGERQRVQSFSSPFSLKSGGTEQGRASTHMVTAVLLPAGRRHNFSWVRTLKQRSSFQLASPEVRKPLQLAVDIISFSCFSIFKLPSNTNAFNSHFHMLDLLHSF